MVKSIKKVLKKVGYVISKKCLRINSNYLSRPGNVAVFFYKKILPCLIKINNVTLSRNLRSFATDKYMQIVENSARVLMQMYRFRVIMFAASHYALCIIMTLPCRFDDSTDEALCV